MFSALLLKVLSSLAQQLRRKRKSLQRPIFEGIIHNIMKNSFVYICPAGLTITNDFLAGLFKQVKQTLTLLLLFQFF